MRNINILVVDDHALVRMGLVTLLSTEPGITVIGEAEDGEQAVKKASLLNPDVIMMDILMPGMDGITATRRILADCPQAKILILTTTTVSDDISRALDAGALGAISKSTANALLPTAIRTVAGGARYLSPEIAETMIQDPPAPKLTERQTAILQSITRGLSNAEIAKQFDIGPECVKTHLSAIFSKLGVANRAEAVGIALRKHLLKT